MALLSKSDMLNADDREYEDVPVPEWGGSVRIMGMRGAERDAFEADQYAKKDAPISQRMANFRAKLLVRCIVDEDFNRVYSDKDAEALGKKNASVLSRLFEPAQRLSGMTREDVDEMSKNSETDQNGGSTSG